jgi:hypothetical protein
MRVDKAISFLREEAVMRCQERIKKGEKRIQTGITLNLKRNYGL